mgnify:CR=1 FL=1
MADSVAVLGLHQTKDFSFPAITYFAPDMKQRIEKLRAAGLDEARHERVPVGGLGGQRAAEGGLRVGAEHGHVPAPLEAHDERAIVGQEVRAQGVTVNAESRARTSDSRSVVRPPLETVSDSLFAS